MGRGTRISNAERAIAAAPLKVALGLSGEPYGVWGSWIVATYDLECGHRCVRRFTGSHVGESYAKDVVGDRMPCVLCLAEKWHG